MAQGFKSDTAGIKAYSTSVSVPGSNTPLHFEMMDFFLLVDFVGCNNRSSVLPTVGTPAVCSGADAENEMSSHSTCRIRAVFDKTLRY